MQSNEKNNINCGGTTTHSSDCAAHINYLIWYWNLLHIPTTNCITSILFHFVSARSSDAEIRSRNEAAAAEVICQPSRESTQDGFVDDVDCDEDVCHTIIRTHLCYICSAAVAAAPDDSRWDDARLAGWTCKGGGGRVCGKSAQSERALVLVAMWFMYVISNLSTY